MRKTTLSRDFLSIDNASFSIKIPPPTEMESFFVFSLPKSGSTLLNNIMYDICRIRNIPHIDIATDSFSQGVPFNRITSEIEQIIWHKGYAYLGFRIFFTFSPHFSYKQNKKIFLLRDPRDILVSLYFSLKHSHILPKTGKASERMQAFRQQTHNLDINQYTLKVAAYYQALYQRYQDHIFDHNLRYYRYEDIIFNKLEWIQNINQYLSLEVSALDMKKIAKRHDILPDKENPHQHIRQVKPGNHQKHLLPDTINQLNQIFAPQLEFFDYSR